MNKITMFFCTLLCLFAACTQQEDELKALEEGKKVLVSFNVPEVALTPITRAGSGVELRYIMEVRSYNETQQSYETIKHRMEQLANGDNTASFEFELQEQGKYRLLFWADYVATQATKADTYTDKYYNTQDLENVMIIPEAYQLNDDSRDAFYGSYDFEKTAQQAILETQKLKRAVGKLVLKEKQQVAYTQSASFTVSYNVPKSFNVATGSTRSADVHAVTANDQNLAGNADSQDYTIFYDYIFATTGDGGYSISGLSLTGEDSQGATFTKDGIPNLPVHQNKRTIVSGSYMLVAPLPDGPSVKVETEITDTWADADVTVDTDEDVKPDVPAFAGKGTQSEPFQLASVDNLKKLMKLVNAGEAVPGSETGLSYGNAYYIQTGEIALNTDTDKICIGTAEHPFKGTYDGNEKTIDGLIVTHDNMAATGLFGIVEGATLTDIRIQDVKNFSKSGVAGGLCGISRGSVNITNVLCDGLNLAGSEVVGGLCGKVESGTLTVKACKMGANSTVVKTKSATGSNVGGFIGEIVAGTVLIEDSYNATKVTNTETASPDKVGGICGKVAEGASFTITRCYVSASVTLTKSASGAAVADAILASGSAVVTDTYFDKAAKRTTTGAIKFASDAWPTWPVGAAWGSIGAYGEGETTIVYPKLSWEQ